MLAQRGVEVVLDDQVAAVDAGGISLASGKRYETRCVVWSAGVRPSPLAAKLDLEHSKHHAVVVKPDLSVSGQSVVWALGDCAQVPKAGGGSCPQTAQHAVHQARLLARNLVASLRGRQTKPYRYRARGLAASLGAHEGLVEIGGRMTISGLPAWLMWRSYYLSQLPGTDRKARVVLDWSFDLPFPQDIASVR
jgi:NADH dehydrogenase